MCSIFYPGEIVLENASCYRVIALHTRQSVGETGDGCHTGWLSHWQYLIRWMAVPCGDLHVTCAQQTEPHNVQTLAADKIVWLLHVHITFRVTFVIFLVIVAYDVAIVLFQMCMNSPVIRIKQKISYQSDSVQQSVTQMAWSKNNNFHAMSSWGWLSHATRGWLSLCESMPDNPDFIFQCWSSYFQRWFCAACFNVKLLI